MQCPRCHAEKRDGLKFCEDCGARLGSPCAQCGAEVTPGKKFCGSCGTPVAGRAADRYATPDSYTPKHLAEKILTSKSALEGERKQVTVLFADLKGSMELLADRDPEEARKLLDPVLERMMEAVHRYEGTVNQVMGDGIMALFGAPVAHEDHAVRGCYAALDMQTAIRRYAEDARRTHGINPQIRVGLNSGEVVVRAIGSDLHMDYTAVGQTTHLAARMEQFAGPGAIVLTADTLRLAEGYIEVKPLGPVPVKGLDAPVEVYEAVGAGPRRSRLHAAAARGLTKFVGRDSELEQLRQALGGAAAGHGQVVAIVGEPGVGKSRLVWEVTHSHRSHGWLIIQAASVSYGKATPYLPVIELLKSYFGIEVRDDHQAIREKVTGKLLTLDRTFEPTLPAVLALLDVPGDDTAWLALDPPQRRQRTLETVKRLLLRETQRHPVLVVLEDLHWVDSETQALLDCLVGSVPTARLLLLVNYRPEYEHRWGGKTYYTQLRLDPLSPESTGVLLQARLGADPTLEPLTRLLIERTEGNPFFLEESVRTLVETGILVGDRGAYRVARPVETVQVPATVHAVLGARIDRLPPEEKRLLQTASVIGKDVPFPLLQAISELAEDPLRRDLTHLQAAEFLYEISLFPELEYTFKHALTHEVAYGSLLQDRRRALHARIVEAIERLYPDRLTEHVDRLAHHAVRGERWEKAVTYLRQAGTKALARSANREAVTCFEHALAAASRLPRTPEMLDKMLDLQLQLRTALWPLAEFDRIARCLEDAERLASSLEDRGRLGRIAAYMSVLRWVTGDFGTARLLGQRAREVAASLEDRPLRFISNYYVGLAHHLLAEYREAEDVFLENARTLPTANEQGPSGSPRSTLVLSAAWLVLPLAERGAFPAGLSHGNAALDLAGAAQDPFGIVTVCYSLAYLYCLKGEVDLAIPLLERGVALCRERDFDVWLPQVTGYLGHAYAQAGRIDEGLSLLERAIAIFDVTRAWPFRTLLTVHRGDACLLAGRLDSALALGHQGLTLAREHGERGHEAWALRLLGEIAAQGDAPDAQQAERYYREAGALANELGMRPLQAHCHLGLGRLYRRTGDQAKAEEHLATATSMYCEMDMGFWLAEATERRPP